MNILKRKVGYNQLKNLKFRIKLFAIIFVSVLLFGTVGFSILENIPLIESFYFTIITISTVGYGDIHPVTNGGRLLAIFVIILGVGAFLGAIITCAPRIVLQHFLANIASFGIKLILLYIKP